MPGQVVAQGFEVVNLAIEDDGDAAILVIHRLLAAGGIDDGQAPVAQCHARFKVEPLTIRAAMGERVSHPLDRRARRVESRILVEDSGYAAHGPRLE